MLDIRKKPLQANSESSQMLSQILTKSKQYINEMKTRPTKRKQIIDQLILSPHFQTWIYLDEIIKILIEQGQDSSLKNIVQQSMIKNYRDIKSFATMMFLYNVQFEGRIDIDIQRTSWAVLYQEFCVNQNELIIFNSWAFNPQNYAKIYDIIQSTLQMIGKNFKQFSNENRITFTDLEFDSIVQWILRTRTETPEKFEIASKLAWIIKDISIRKNENDYITKEPLVMKKIFENIGDSISDSGNAFLLLQPEQNYNEKAIEYFCHIQDYYLSDLNEEYLKNVFKNLTIGGVTNSVLIIIDKISSLLSNNEEYFKLRHIYQNFILPYLTKFKAHKNLAEQVYDSVEFYATGFLKHCNIGKIGIEYLLEDIQEIQIPKIKYQWVSLALAVGSVNSLEDYVRKSFKEKGIEVTKQISNFVIDPTKVWSVTLRTGKKYKKYIKNETKQFKGIQNRANECYIISVVQSLFFTEQLQRLLDHNRESIKGKQLLLDELRILFSELSGKRQTKNITIGYLKKLGPEEFRVSESQEDSMQYLIQLFDQIEMDCKKVPGMMAKFNQIFKIDCQHTTKCLNCQKETTNVQNSYLHTIPHTELLQLTTQEKEIEDYKCENCKKLGLCKNVREISPKCKIFIVHINRFSMKNGICKKQLSNQTILRKFLNYELVGMICHIGKNINSGHYKFFAKDKRNEKQWIELSDKNVLKFSLDQADEEFERQMQTDMAPYMLFYRRID